MNKFFLIIFLIFSSNCFSQVIKGKIVDSKTKENLSYTIISILNKPHGSISDTLGDFLIEIGKQDTIVISSVSYPPSRIYNFDSSKDTIDLGEIHLVNIIKDVKPPKKNLFRRKKNQWYCGVIETIKLTDLKQQDLTMRCSSGQVKYQWAFKSERYLELDFKGINFCK